MIKKKTFLSVDLCLCCVLSCSEIVLSQDFFLPKKIFLSPNHGGDLW